MIMATRRVFRALAHHGYSIPRRPIGSSHNHFRSILTQIPGSTPSTSNPSPSAKFATGSYNLCKSGAHSFFQRYLATSSQGVDSKADEDAESSSEEEVETVSDINARVFRADLGKYEIQEADEIGYKIVCPAKTGERPNKPKDPIFAVVQVGSHQFKVSCGDRIVVEKLKYADVNQKILLNKVLMLGTKSQTVIGRPVLPDAAVYALVEEQALGAEVIIFKKKRRKNYRRTNYHRQELTRLRIYDIKGIEESLGENAVAA